MNAAVSLSEILSASALTSRKDRFRCEPYRCVMPARDCLARQAKAKIPDLSHGQRMEIAKCVGCSLGAEVSARCASLEDDAGPLAHVAGSTCTVPRCTQRATSDGLCTKHLLRRYSAGRDANAGSAVVARAIAPLPPPLPAVETPAATPAPQPSIVSEEPMKTDSLAPSCAVLGCRELVPGVRADTPPHLAGCCRPHRHKGSHAITKGRTTAARVVTYMGEGPHPTGKKGPRSIAKAAETPRLTKVASKACAPRPTTAAKAPKAPDDRFIAIPSHAAVEATDGTLTAVVSVPLPEGLVRARRCADIVGIVALEALATLRADSSLVDVALVLAKLPARAT